MKQRHRAAEEDEEIYARNSLPLVLFDMERLVEAQREQWDIEEDQYWKSFKTEEEMKKIRLKAGLADIHRWAEFYSRLEMEAEKKEETRNQEEEGFPLDTVEEDIFEETRYREEEGFPVDTVEEDIFEEETRNREEEGFPVDVVEDVLESNSRKKRLTTVRF
ncbi:uncharacterized protein LOC135359422 isoform X3 [Latimeria chalumnae]